MGPFPMPPKKFMALRKAKKNKPPFPPQTFLSPHLKNNSLEAGEKKKKRKPNPTCTFFLNFDL